MKQTIKSIALALAASAATMFAAPNDAYINYTGSTTSWTNSPAITTGLPGVFTIGENAYVGPNILPMLGQTFTATLSGTLTGIQIAASGAPGQNFLFLWDLGLASGYSGISGATVDSSLQTLSTYPGANMFAAGTSFTWGGSGTVGGVRQISFDTGNSNIQLTSGHLYYFGIAPNDTANTVTWQRISSDPYAGGMAYRENSWLLGSGVRDFALAIDVAPVPEPSTLALLTVAGGMVVLARRQKRQ